MLWPKSCFESGVLGVGDQRLQQHLGIEDVNAHRGVHGVGIEGRAEAGRAPASPGSPCISPFLRHLDHAEPRHLVGRNGQRGQRDFGVGLLVVVQHAAVVHLVDVVAAEDDHVLGLLAADRIDVLVHRVGRAHVPVGAGALHGRHQLEELAQLLRHNARPAFADVPVQRERLVLREDIHAAQAGIDAVGKRDIDDAVVSAEGNRRLGPVPRQGKQPLSRSARK